MCLAIPGKLLDRRVGEGGLPVGTVQYDHLEREVCLAFTPDARPGQYVIVQVGYAIQVISPQEAQTAWEVYDQMLEAEQHA